jgi:DNA polymerase II small subunit
MDSQTAKQEIVTKFLEKGILVNPNFFLSCQDLDIGGFLQTPPQEGLLFLDSDALGLLRKKQEINWLDFEASKAMFEKGKNKKVYENFINLQNIEEKTEASKPQNTEIKIIYNYQGESKKREISDFIAYYNRRFKQLEKILQQRQELQSPISISRLKTKKDSESVSIIGMIKEKETTKNKNIILELEDESGTIKVLVNKTRQDLFEFAKDLVHDEVIGVVGMSSDKIIFANNILLPDIPNNKEFKKSSEDSYAVFTADLHVGSRMFLAEEFSQFLGWLNGTVGNEMQKEIASKVKYIFIVGDIIDGVGVYPRQEEELVIKDIYEQYAECAKLLEKIPQHINVIICPGNHDAMRISEPQPCLYKDFAKTIHEIPNVILVSNPAVINICSTETFPGFDVLLYHGYSFDYYVPNVESIRNSGGYDRADLIMKFLLQARHLAPTHTSTLFLPETNEDPLVIKTIPDFFATGHIHSKPIISNYRNVTTMSCGCWQSKTPFQEKVGHNPGPAKVPVVNLKTREVKILRFDKQ